MLFIRLLISFVLSAFFILFALTASSEGFESLEGTDLPPSPYSPPQELVFDNTRFIEGGYILLDGEGGCILPPTYPTPKQIKKETQYSVSDEFTIQLSEPPAPIDKPIMDIGKRKDNLRMHEGPQTPIFPNRCLDKMSTKAIISIRFNTDKDGNATNIHIYKSTNSCFNKAAIKAVKSGHYAPNLSLETITFTFVR
ncbi:MAG: energy transducer TonB [bacterium]